MPRSLKEPIWSSQDTGPRVLVEVTDFTKRDAITKILAREGFAVRTCGGPDEFDERCPLTDRGECSGVAGADVVVNSMHPFAPSSREMLDALRDRHPGTPLVVEVPMPLVTERPGDYQGIRVLPQPMTRVSLLEAVEEVLAG